MEFNDGSQYRVVTDPARHMRERELYCFRVASKRNGALYVDTAFQHHRQTLAPMRGLLLYQFVHVVDPPEMSADFFLRAVDGLRENEMVMLDPESGGGFTNDNAAAWCKRWLDRVESTLDTRAWVYVPSALAASLNPSFTKDRLVMAPRYTRQSGTIMSPKRGAEPWWPYDAHQFTDNGYFPGCAQSGDLSYTALSVQQMLARCNPNGIPVPPVHGGPS